MFENEEVNLWSFLQGVEQITKNPEIKSAVISREMALFLAEHIHLLEEQLDMTKTVTHMAMYGASKRKAKKLARAENPRMPARKVAKIVNLVFGNWSIK